MNKGEIWLVELPSVNGHEQSGIRPVIILAEVDANMVIGVPLTTNVRALRFPSALEIKPTKTNGLKDISVALVFQIRAIDKRRFSRKIGDLDSFDLKEIDTILKKLLKI